MEGERHGFFSCAEDGNCQAHDGMEDERMMIGLSKECRADEEMLCSTKVEEAVAAGKWMKTEEV